MNNSGVRSAVRVIRLDAFDPRQAVAPPKRPADEPEPEPEPEWSSLPSVVWPVPIGSARWPVSGDRLSAVAPAGDIEEDAESADGVPTVPADVSTTFSMDAGTTTSGPLAVAQMPRLPHGVVTSWPLRFQASAPEYARLWLVDAALVLLTLGLYLPWARVRSQRYLMRHTRLAGHALDYHEPASLLLPRYVLALGLLLGVAGAWAGGSPLAGMLALSLAVAVWPLLVYMSLSQRLAHISWARRRLVFEGSCPEVYRAMCWPLAGVATLAWLLMAAAVVRGQHQGPLSWLGWVGWGAALALWLAGMPAFVWTWYLFRQRHLRLGPVRLRWKATRPAVAMLFLRTLVWATLTAAFSAGVAAAVLGGMLMLRGRLGWPGASLNHERVLAAMVFLSVCATVRPYAQARLQNLIWNKSGNRYLRIRSKLSVSGFVLLQCKHACLLVLTLGLYWPWAVIATRRMRTRALTVWSRVDAEVFKAHWPPHRPTSQAPSTHPGSPTSIHKV